MRLPDIDRDPVEEWGTKTATKAQLEELRAKVNLLEFGGITADKLGGGTISSQSIQLAENASLFSGSTTSDGFVLDVDGLRFYDGGVNTIDLRADGGTATFSGTITASTITGGTFQTASSGERIVLAAGTNDQILFYTGEAAETVPGRILVFSDASYLSMGWQSPRAGFDYAENLLLGARTGVLSSVWGGRVYSNTGVVKGAFIVDSIAGIVWEDIAFVTAEVLNDMSFQVNAGFFDVIRPAATNNFQLRLEGPAGGLVALGVDGPATGNRINVQDFAGTTPLPISASAFTVVSNQAGKQNVKAREGQVLERIKKLKPVDYERPGYDHPNRRDTKGKPKSAPTQQYTGFLAEDLMTQFPEAVVRGKEGEPHSIDLMALVAILTQAVQELAAKGK